MADYTRTTRITVSGTVEQVSELIPDFYGEYNGEVEKVSRRAVHGDGTGCFELEIDYAAGGSFEKMLEKENGGTVRDYCCAPRAMCERRGMKPVWIRGSRDGYDSPCQYGDIERCTGRIGALSLSEDHPIGGWKFPKGRIYCRTLDFLISKGADHEGNRVCIARVLPDGYCRSDERISVIRKPLDEAINMIMNDRIEEEGWDQDEDGLSFPRIDFMFEGLAIWE